MELLIIFTSKNLSYQSNSYITSFCYFFLCNRGLSSVVELLMELVSLILDVISRPTWWGLSLELGLKLPFSNAYFPYKSDFLRTLTGPFSYESFLQLVHMTRKSAYLHRELCDPTIKPSAVRVASIDHKSIWYILTPCQRK